MNDNNKYMLRWKGFLIYATIFVGVYITVFRYFERAKRYPVLVDFGEHHQIIGIAITLIGVILLVLRNKKII